MKASLLRETVLIVLIIILLFIVFLMGFGVIELHIGKTELTQQPKSVLPEENKMALPSENNPNQATETSPLLESYTGDEQENIRIYARLNKAVVNISTEVIGYNWFLEPVPKEGTSGSGSIIDQRGYILTNNHVVENAYKVNITLADGSQFEGDVIGSDPENDLAVINFNPADHPLTVIPFGKSENLRVGQKVLAIGNPFAFERTLTTGIISGLGRPLRNERGIILQDLIQTDASINPGNSGGPLLNAQGELIGVNTMIYTPSGGSVGIGFSVPVDRARRVVSDLIQYGHVQRGWLDVEPVQIFPSLARYAKLPVTQGVLISQVIAGGNAEAAGLRGGSRQQAVRTGQTVIYLGGDIITALNGEIVLSLGDLYASLESSHPGDAVTLTIIRSGKEKQVEIILATRPQSNL